MVEQKPRDDPSTEQILASIGRIVAEGEGGPSAPADAAPPTTAPDPALAEDVLDLVDVVDERGNAIPLQQALWGGPPAHAARSSERSAAGGRASEEQVLEVLRPMLENWLDTHMPPIVERLVRRETERAARCSEPE